jgi:hypothetical protein
VGATYAGETSTISPAKAVLAILLGLIVLVGVIVGGYLGGWWLNTDINNRQAHLNRTTYEMQATYRDEMVRKIADVRAIDAQLAGITDTDERAQLQAQRAAVVGIVCRDNTHINGGLDTATATFVQGECQ